MVYPLTTIRQGTSTTTGNNIKTIELNSEPSTAVAAGSSVNLKFGATSFWVPIASTEGTWWFTCTDNSVVWNAADEALIANIGGSAVPGAIANGSKIAAIGDSTQQFRLNGVLANGPLIYRSAGMVTIQRPEGKTVYEVTVGGGGGGASAAASVPTQSTAPDVATNQFWFNNAGGGMIVNVSDGTSWFAIN
jgi:hypothetical protein